MVVKPGDGVTYSVVNRALGGAVAKLTLIFALTAYVVR